MRRWTRVEYERLVDLGVFQPGERLEPLDGWLVVREPQGTGEVALSTCRVDHEYKASLYARRAGSTEARYGWRDGSVATLVLALDRAIPVADLLP